MKVRELIEILRGLDGDLELVLTGHEVSHLVRASIAFSSRGQGPDSCDLAHDVSVLKDPQ